MGMSIDVEFSAGTDITNAVSQAKEKAKQWDVSYVCFKFNGVSLSIGRDADVDLVVKKYHGKNHGFIIAS